MFSDKQTGVGNFQLADKFQMDRFPFFFSDRFRRTDGQTRSRQIPWDRRTDKEQVGSSWQADSVGQTDRRFFSGRFQLAGRFRRTDVFQVGSNWQADSVGQTDRQ